MALPVPMYVGQNALHQPSVIRLLSYGLTTGTQGVIGVGDAAVRALGTPGAAIQALPAAYMVRAKHSGGSYEGYAGKWDVAEQVAVSPTSSAGPRSDLVILRIEDPYVSGAGSWQEPADLVNGPYAFVRVIENVSSTTWDVAQVNSTWSAITLAKITRPASTGVVQQSHITDLRSLASLGGTRTVYIENPPATPPPIAQSSYVQFKPSAGDPNYGASSGGSDTVHNYLNANSTAWQNWPSAASWSVPVPSWATSMDVDSQVYGAQILNGDIYGEVRMLIDGAGSTPLTVAIDLMQVPGRHIVPYGATMAVPSSIRGKVVTFRLQARHFYNGPGRLDAKGGTTSRLSVNFQRVPD